MNSSVRLILLGAFGAVLLSLSVLAKSSAADMTEVDLNTEKVQVVHGTTPNSDSTSMTLDITNNGEGICQPGDDLIAGGLKEIGLFGGTCLSYENACISMMGCPILQFNDSIPYFVSHTIAGHQYGTFFSSSEPGGAGSSTLSAKATKLATPMGACGRWTLNLTASQLNLSSITMNPIALIIEDGDGLLPQCFDIPDAVIGPVIVH